MNKYSVEVVATAALAAILIQPTLAFAQGSEQDTITFTVETGDPAINGFTPGSKVLFGGTLPPATGSLSAASELTDPRCTRPSGSASTLKLQSVTANERALESRLRLKQSTGSPAAEEGTVIRLENGDLFAAGSEKLSTQGQETLRNVAAMINRHASPEVRVVVNADQSLEKKRADTIRNFLAQSSKITVDQISIVKAAEGSSSKEYQFTTSILLANRS